MKRDALEDPYIPEKVQKAARKLLDYIEENNEAFEEIDTQFLEDLRDATDPKLDCKVGSILHHREPKFRNEQMLVVVGIDEDGERCQVVPIVYIDRTLKEEEITAFLEKNPVPKGKAWPFVHKDNGQLVKVIGGTFYKHTDDFYVVKQK